MSTIVQQAVQWLEKMSIGVEYNAELQEFEFEYKDAFVIINTDTPEGVLSLCYRMCSLMSYQMRIKLFFRRLKNGGLNISTQNIVFVNL